MIEWTRDAERERDAYLARVRNGLSRDAVDSDEVVEDLSRHIEEELAGQKVSVVTVDVLRKVLDRLGSPAEDSRSEPAAEESPEPKQLRSVASRVGVSVLLVFGVLIPGAALVLELLSAICSQVLFDPLPTWLHVVAVALVPLSSLLAVVTIFRGRCGPGWLRLLMFLNGVAIGVSIYYSLVFLPMVPFALLGILYLGLGLIPLSPYCGLICAFILRRMLGPLSPALSGKRTAVLISATVVVLLAMELPRSVTLLGMNMACSESADQRRQGLRLLRSVGREEIVLRACYIPGRPVKDVTGWLVQGVGRPVDRSQAREIYYRLTGTPFNAVQPPDMMSVRSREAITFDDWDFEQGGDAVAARLADLYLRESRLDGVVYPDEAAGYLEWTFCFENLGVVQREARARIQLPEGGVVSRLTLWVDGEEREAAFSSRSKVKTAYKRIVQRRRDPVLVTTCGPDLVQLQCFPVPPGGRMKTRIGITFPLEVMSKTNAVVVLPTITEQNFQSLSDLTHGVWLESRRRLGSLPAWDGIKVERLADGRHGLRGDLTDDQLAEGVELAVHRESVAPVVVADPRASEAWTSVLQSVRKAEVASPDLVVIVLDGSRRMAAYAEGVADWLGGLPEEFSCLLKIAGDEVLSLPSSGPAELAELVRTYEYAGGCDNLPALVEGWELAAGAKKGVVLWLHATQPLELSKAESLRQRLERRPSGPRVLSLQFGTGPNRVGEKLHELYAYQRLEDANTAGTLARLIGRWDGSIPSFELERRAVAGVDPTPAGGGGSHLVRLWAYDEVRRLAQARSEADRLKAGQIAAKYQLVTPVSGAVVLETQEQYAEAGLKPIDPGTAPSVVPEPETWAMMIIGLVIVVVARAGRRRITLRSAC